MMDNLRWTGRQPILALFLTLLLFAWSAAGPTDLSAHDQGYKHVLILHTRQPGQSWFDNMTASIENILDQSGEILNLQIEYLDARHSQDPEYLDLLRASLQSDNLQKHPFDLVLLTGNDTLDFALSHRRELFNDSPIVFCGIGDPDPDRLTGIDRITGVTTTLAIRDTVELALRLNQGAEEIVLIGQTPETASYGSDQKLRNSVAELAPQARFSDLSELALPELTQRLSRLDRNSLVFINGAFADQDTTPLPFSIGLRQVLKASRAPLYAFLDSYLDHGIVGGKLASAAHQGQLAADQALRILRGENIDNLPMVTENAASYMFDDRQLKRFGIEASQLPDGSRIINQPPAFYTLSKTQLWVILGIMAVFTLDLLFVLYRQRRTEAALKESVAQTRLLLNSAAEGIYGLDLESKCTFLNPAGLRLLGYQDEDSLLGRDLHALIHHTRKDGTAYAADDCEICHAYQQNSRVHLEDEVFWRKDGTSFPVEYWSYPLQKGKRIVGAVVSFLDISVRKEAEHKLREANRELDAFVYTASHDLRTPLSVISGYTDLLREEHAEQLDDEAQEYLTAIEKHGDKMTGLIDDLLALARAGTIQPPAEPVSSEKVVGEVLQGFDEQIRNSGIYVDLQPLPAVRIPETLLEEIFDNLIGNALRYAAAKGKSIEIGGERLEDRVRFFVRDHGPGIPVEEASRIFEVFYRGSTGRQISGSGIGLATVQKIARLYGGRAWVEDTRGGGATFLVEIKEDLGSA